MNTADRMKQIIDVSFQNGYILRNWVETNQSLITTPLVLKEKLKSVANEELSFLTLSGTPVLSETEKVESIFDYVIKVYHGHTDYISYKDLSNINDEVKKIYDSLNPEKNENFIYSGDIIYTQNNGNQVFGSCDYNDTNLDIKFCQRFLCINDQLPTMITSEIGKFSAELNKNDSKFKKFLQELRKRTINYR